MLGEEDVIPLDSDGDGDEASEAHPADELIVRKALERKTPAAAPTQPTADAAASEPAAKRRRVSGDIALNITDEGALGGDVIDLEDGEASGPDSVLSSSESEPEPRQPQSKRAFKPPVGVTLIADDEEVVQVGVLKANRQARYFTGGSFESAKKCFNCGQTGHYSRDCPNEGKQRPCVLCARFGHDEWNCPARSRRCYHCNRLGHLSRECPYHGTADIIPMLCTRCGRPECAASGEPDWVRAEGGCTQEYLSDDAALVTCVTCGRAGHCLCAPCTAPATSPSCHNCGRAGHTGAECPEALTQAARRERLDASNRRGLDAARSAPLAAAAGGAPPGRPSYWQQGDGSIAAGRWQGGDLGATPAYATPEGGFPQQPPAFTAPAAYAQAAGGYGYPGSGGRVPPPYASYSAYTPPEQSAFPRNRKR